MPDTVLLPGVHLKAALDEDRASLYEKLAAELRKLVPCVNVDERREAKIAAERAARAERQAKKDAAAAAAAAQVAEEA